VLEAPPGEEGSLILLKIPPLVIHGFTALEGREARILNIPTLPYRYENPDEFRYAWNSSEIPYRWPDEVSRGG
jgi:dTDP-4-dehydrorhamnose 3,5-epimerase